jgi:hypothetical protein
MALGYGWRVGCPATGGTDEGVGSDEWFGISSKEESIAMRSPNLWKVSTPIRHPTAQTPGVLSSHTPPRNIL